MRRHVRAGESGRRGPPEPGLRTGSAGHPAEPIEQRGAAAGDVFAELYTDLREIARRQRQRWQQDYTLNTTALLHEAYLKLADQTAHPTRSRAHFLALAARSMRHILCNYARDRRALKRGGGVHRIALHEEIVDAATEAAHDEGSDVLVALDAALRRLAVVDARQSQVVECRFFGGLTVEETAEALGVSVRTIKRDWAVAQAWLQREMAVGDA